MLTTTTDRVPRIAWLVALGAAGWLALVIAAFLILPPLVHPLLRPAELRPLDADQRIQRQQDQRRLQDDVRATLVQGSVGLLALAGAGVGVYVATPARRRRGVLLPGEGDSGRPIAGV
jgi:hypothetical protein